MNQIVQFVAQIYDVRTKRDGGGRLQLDFGVDALPAILELQRLNAAGDINLALAIVPHGKEQYPEKDDERIDEATGEIIF